MDRNAMINIGFILANIALIALFLMPRGHAATDGINSSSQTEQARPVLDVEIVVLPLKLPPPAAEEDPEAIEKKPKAGQKPEAAQKPISASAGKVFHSLPGAEKVVALTFDDGPQNTLKILAILEEKQAPATFFLLGNLAKARPKLVRAIADSGCEVANHTWSHPNLKQLGADKIRWQLESTAAAFADLGVEAQLFMRPPYGHWNSQVQGICARMDYQIVLWDVDTRDWEYKNADKVLAKAKRELKPGSIVLFHEGKSVTLEVLPKFIDEARELGYEFVLLSDYIKP